MIRDVDNDYEEENEGDGVDNRGSGMELNSEKQEVRVSGSGVRDDEDTSFALFDMGNDKIAPQDQALSTSNSSNNDDDGGGEVEEEQDEEGISSGMVASGGDTYKSLLSEFDDFVANEKNGAMAGTSRALSYGFVVGDMVWGKVKSHPWWPGHIFNEELASSSVRRTRREGHVLVAFFGDSSYGWFDPAELIPFEVHFAEKSQQTNQKNFVKAVEEAVDEASRRYGLGLTCKCRNPYNFRPANVQGYFAVDVLDFEPGGIYSVDQIKKARDEFRPGKTLEFLKQVAMRPQEFDGNTIDFTKYSAAICTFRKAVFEEYDETYAQAFGAPPSRPANDKAKKYDEPVKIAPLSGPLVIAEALGGRKNSNKFLKGKDSPKKDRYLLKKRVEPSDSRELHSVPKQPSSASPAVYVDGLSGITGSDYLLQKRDPEPNASVKHEQISLVNKEGADPSDVTGNEIASLNQAPGLHGALSSEGSFSGANPSLDMEKGGALQLNKGRLDMGMDPADDSKPDLPGKGALQGAGDGASPSLQSEGDPMVDHRHEGSANVPMSSESSHKIEVNFSARAEGDGGLANLQGSYPGPLEFKHSAGTNAGALIKKAKILKRSMGGLSSENSVMGEKKKKRKKEFDAETSPGRPPKKRFSTGKGGVMSVNLAGKSTHISLAARDDPRVIHQKKVTATLPMLGVMNIELDSQKLLTDLHALALDPFHGAERSGSSIAMQFFLRFRSLVYQKSLFLPPQSETAGLEVRHTKSSSISGLSDNSVGGGARDITASRPVKSISRPEDPTKAGRKRMPSDRQEEIAAKRSKKIAQLKSLSTERKVTQKSLEIQRAEGKEPVAPGPPRPKAVKIAPVKKMEPPVRTAEPTMLVMKFPPETSLPSVAELKARFARFGTLDQSAIRVFWTSSQCRVVFRRKLNAQAAYRYAISNATLFGNVAVRYNLREVGAPASDAPESDTSIDASRSRDPASAILHQPLSQSPVQIKSILKKPPGDEAAAQATSGRMTPRVKFMLGGEESSSRGEQLMMVGNRNFNSSDNNASFADGGASSTSVAMDINSKNFQKVIPPPSLLPPLLPFPPQFAKAPVNNSQHTTITTAAATTTTVIAPRNMHNPPLIAPPPSNIQSVDISQQMLNLLTRCNDVVSSVTGLLGYVPYHPL